jgi:uncharacterized protein (UPF0332 family)
MIKEIEDLTEKAKRFLRSAEVLLVDGDYDSCVSRCYYAMFFLTEAILLTKGLKASSHKGVISIFGEHFIKTGILRKELGRALNDTYDSRQIGDYAIGFMITKDEAESRLEKARNFVTEVEQHLKEVI